MAKTDKAGRTWPDVRAGFLVTPEKLSPEEWSRRARPQQRRLGTGETEPEGYPEARDRIWQERCAYVTEQALARGEREGSLRAPYPTDEEVAARVDADRRATLPAADKGADGQQDTVAEFGAPANGPGPPPE